MIDFYVTGQSIRYASPVIAANSLDFLQARFHFSGDTWNGYSKWAHFRQGETVFDLNLVDDEIKKEMHLNLSLGSWEVYLTGVMGESRLTTVPVIVQVRESGLIDEPLHQIPLTVAEQLDSKASLALDKANAVLEAIESGDLVGKGFQILGYFSSLDELAEEVTEPERGDAYGIGTQAPYDIYVYDGVGQQWVNNGSIQGPSGNRGEDGATFIPSIDDYGNLSWINDAGLENPETVNIRGPKGDAGEKGEDGASPYELAVQEGFSGTEATFNWSLAHIASHAAQHAAGGTDPLTIDGDAIEDAAVSRSKLAADVKILAFSNVAVEASVWQEDETYGDYPFRAAVSLEGVTENFAPSVTFSPEDVLENIFAPVAACYGDGIYIYANELPGKDMTIPSVLAIPVGSGGIAVNRTNAGGGSAFAVIDVSYPEGAVCTCTNGVRTIQAKDTSGRWMFQIPRAGEWVVRATQGGRSNSKTISVSESKAYVVILNFELVLYNSGDTCDEITGGWGSSGGGEQEGSTTFEEDRINVGVGYHGDRSLYTINQIDLSDYDTLEAEVGWNNTGTGHYPYMGVTASKSATPSYSASLQLTTTEKSIRTLDISNVDGPAYISFSGSGLMNIYVYSVKLIPGGEGA